MSRPISHIARIAGAAGLLAGLGLLATIVISQRTMAFDLLLPLTLLVMACIPLAIFALVLSMIAKTRRVGVASLAVIIPLMVITAIGMRLGNDVRTGSFERLVERTQPLIDAIERYEADHQRAPDALSQLVPDYLSEVPGTGMPMYPEFAYTGPVTEPPDAATDAWELSLEFVRGIRMLDRFVYRSSGDYTDLGELVEEAPLDEVPPGGVRPNPARRIGDWAYAEVWD